MKSFAAVAALALAAGLRSAAAEANVHPIEKVIKMLGGLKLKVEFEGKKEELLYVKYEKWCQDSTKTLSTAIKGEEEAISMLESEIDAKTKENATLSKEIDDLDQTLLDLAAAETKATNNRAQAANVYTQASQDLQATIIAFGSAITELVAAKGSPTTLLQVLGRAEVQEALALAQASPLEEDQRSVLVALQEQNATNATNYTQKIRPTLQAAGDYGSHVQSYNFKSDNVIELLKGLKAKFEKDLLTATTEETNSINNYNLAKKARDGEKTAATTAKTGKSMTLGTVQQDLAQHKIDLKDQQDDYTADTGSLKSTEQSCQIKKREWDERSKVRAQEAEAMSVATEILAKASGVHSVAPTNPTAPTSPIAAANPSPPAGTVLMQAPSSSTFATARTHVFAQQSEAVEESSRLNQELARQGSLSFLQIAEDPQQRAIQLLRKAAAVTHSRLLDRLAQELSVQQGGTFDQVANIIQKMVHRLEDEQMDEDKHKMWCDEELSKTNISKTDKEDKIEELRLHIQKDQGTVMSLSMQSQMAQDMLTQLASFVAEATEIREVGKKENAEALKDSQQAQDSIAQATSVIETFYKDSGMVQKQAWEFAQAPVTLPSEPSTWSAGYTGVADPQAQPSGIITVLQRIGSDFATMEADTRAQEQTDQQAYEDEMKQSEIEKARRTKEIEMKTQEKKRLLDNIDSLTKSRKHFISELDAVNQYLKDLEPACITGDSTYEDRKRSRSEEITALKMSEQILKDAFNQKNQTSSNQTSSSNATTFFLRGGA